MNYSEARRILATLADTEQTFLTNEEAVVSTLSFEELLSHLLMRAQRMDIPMTQSDFLGLCKHIADELDEPI